MVKNSILRSYNITAHATTNGAVFRSAAPDLEDLVVQRQPCCVLLQAEALLVNHLHPLLGTLHVQLSVSEIHSFYTSRRHLIQQQAGQPLDNSLMWSMKLWTVSAGSRSTMGDPWTCRAPTRSSGGTTWSAHQIQSLNTPKTINPIIKNEKPPSLARVGRIPGTGTKGYLHLWRWTRPHI